MAKKKPERVYPADEVLIAAGKKCVDEVLDNDECYLCALDEDGNHEAECVFFEEPESESA